jgi:hypothetical protein
MDRSKDLNAVRGGHAHERQMCEIPDTGNAVQHPRASDTATHAAIRRAHEAGRRYRLDHPTPGEAALRKLLIELAFELVLPRERFDYCLWRVDPCGWSLSPRHALAEGGVGPYVCDILLPVRRLAIEAEGGIHALQREYDARRRAFLIAQGLSVAVFPNETLLDLTTARAYLIQLLEQPTPALLLDA